MKKTIIVLATIILVVLIFYIFTPFSNTQNDCVTKNGILTCTNSYSCVMKYDIDNENQGIICPSKGSICHSDNTQYTCGVCCLLDIIYNFKSHLLISAIICFVIFFVWRIFKNKIKKEELGIIAKTLLFLAIIALILFFLISRPMPIIDPLI